MHRCGTGILIIAISLGLLTGCVGKSSGGGGGQAVKTVTLFPSGIQSIDIGATPIFSATAKNALGQTVIAASIQFNVVSGDSNPAPLTINADGTGCAGTWDATGTICSPGSPGIAIVTATSEGVSSAQTTIYVHQHINRIAVSRIDTPPPTHPECFSQGQTWNYQANAYDINNVDITNSVGPFTWSASNFNVLTVNSVAGLPNNQTQVTAKMPGITPLFASVSGATSAPIEFTTCLVSYIRLQIEGSTENSFSLSTGSKAIKATAVDTLGVTLATPPLTWSSSNPEVASFSNATSTTGTNSITAHGNGGTTDITASCTPPTCNIGVLPGLPVYASGGNLPVGGQPVGPQAFGVISGSVAPSKAPTYTAWAATTQCGNGLNCLSYTFSVTPGSKPLGGSVPMFRTPNSMMFNPQGTRIYFGSDQGLMYLDVASSSTSVTPVSGSSTPCNVSLCGKVLAISLDGNRVVVSDSASSPHQVYIFNASSTSTAPIDLVLSCPASLGPNCTATATGAAFSPDEMKIFILGVATDQNGNLSNTLSVYSSVDAFQTTAISTPVSPNGFSPASDVAFSADGSFALTAGVPANDVLGFATCDVAAVAGGNISGLPATPLRIFPLPGVQDIEFKTDQSFVIEDFVALEPPVLQLLTARFTRDPQNNGTCSPPYGYVSAPQYPAPAFAAGATINLGQGNFSPLYMRVTGDGSGAVVVANMVPAVFFVDLNQQTTTPIPLVNNGLPLAASASSDGNQVFVAACDAYTNNNPKQCTSGSVHIIDKLSGGDIQQVPYENFNTNNSMCTVASAPPCFPDLIAIKAQ